VGITKAEWSTRIRLGAAFRAAEITLQIVATNWETGAGKSCSARSPNGQASRCWRRLARSDSRVVQAFLEPAFDLTRGSVPVSRRYPCLDSLGVGFALPAVDHCAGADAETVSITTTVFTFWVAFGQRIGGNMSMRRSGWRARY